MEDLNIFQSPITNPSQQEQSLVTFWRSIHAGALEVSILHSVPVEAKINFPYFLKTQLPGRYQLTDKETEIINIIRFMEFGKLYVEIVMGQPTNIEPHSYRTVKFFDKSIKK